MPTHLLQLKQAPMRAAWELPPLAHLAPNRTACCPALSQLDLCVLLFAAMLTPLLAFVAGPRSSSFPLHCMPFVAGPPLMLLLRRPDT